MSSCSSQDFLRGLMCNSVLNATGEMVSANMVASIQNRTRAPIRGSTADSATAGFSAIPKSGRNLSLPVLTAMADTYGQTESIFSSQGGCRLSMCVTIVRNISAFTGSETFDLNQELEGSVSVFRMTLRRARRNDVVLMREKNAILVPWQSKLIVH